MSKAVIVTRDGMEWELTDSQIVSEDKDYMTIRKTYNPKVGLPVLIDTFIPQKQKGPMMEMAKVFNRIQKSSNPYSYNKIIIWS